jgi:hypothetical protein
MGMSLEERKRKLIEDVCASCAGGGGDAPSEDGYTMGDTGPDATYDPKLNKGLKMLRRKSKKKEKLNGT